MLGALLLRRLPAALNGLAVSCLLLVLLDPSWVDDLGFQLSVAATAGLLALAVPLRERFRRLGVFAAPLAVTLAAQLATLPWALAAFGRISLSRRSPTWSRCLGPRSRSSVVAAWALLRLAIGAGADALLAVLDLLARPLAWLEQLPASAWVTLPLQAPWWAAWTVALARLLCAAAAAALDPRWRAGRSRPSLVGARRRRAVPELVMLDVGQGDALLLRDGDAALLVDGGGWRRPGFGGRVLLPALAALGVRRLDVLAVTHADRDHCGGAVDLLRELPVGQVWAPSGIASTGCGAGLHVRRHALRRARRRRRGARGPLAVARARPGARR